MALTPCFLRHLDDELFLPAQTAGPFFTIGGVVANCVHGGAVNYGLIHNAVLAMRVIDAQGKIRWVTEEEDLRFYRSSFGCLGVITHVKMQCVRFKETLRDHTRSRIADLSGNYQDENARIKASLLPDTDIHLWQEYYWNPYDDDLLSIRWRPTAEKLSTHQAPHPNPNPNPNPNPSPNPDVCVGLILTPMGRRRRA